MKKGVALLSLTIVIALICVYLWQAGKLRDLSSPSPLVNETSVKSPQLENGISEIITKIQTPQLANKFAHAKTCVEIMELCPSCQYQWDRFVEEMELVALEAASSGPYSTMPKENLISLAHSNDTNGMFYHGSNLVWKGLSGFTIFRPDFFENRPSNQQIKEHKLDLELVKKGENFIFQAAIKGKPMAWLELRNIKIMILRKLTKLGNDNKEQIRELIAQHSSISKLISEIYKKDPFLLELHSLGIINEMDWLAKSHFKDMAPEEVQKEKELIKALSDDFYNKYLEKWIHERNYNGEEIYPEQYNEEFAEFYKYADKLCWPDY